jgi:hypothetical protein
VLVLGIPAAAVAVGEGRAIMGGERNPRSGDLSRETEIIADNGTYGTRQSNKNDGDGGGAIYGCRSNPDAEACVRANNLKGGRAFDFETVGGEAGRITVGNATAAPFSTNATGTVANLSADKLDGRDSGDFASGALLWARVQGDGSLAGDRGATGATRNEATNTYIVTFNRNVSNCSYGATPSGGNAADKPTPTVAGGGNDNNVRVDWNPGAGATPFHLQVLC